eukprot:TRINITY_DN502_c5_g2_i1.p1 TRINITY_DN502_c5_g2~~TRINITY_DN502_c5_g2_i1.p1  ORF type:complete len:302 (+),score=79.82 TRINITY_DN502_c5_g2_i1:50-907(+)
MAQGMNNAIFEFCMRHSDDPSGKAEGIPERDPAEYEWLRQALAEIKSDYERMENCMGILNNDVKDVDAKEIAMEEVLYFVEDLDNAVDFVKKMKSGKTMLKLIADPDTPPSLREGAANIIGTVTQNNIISQAILLTDGALPILIDRLIIEEHCRAKLIYAISGCVRGNKDIITAFLSLPKGLDSIVSVLPHFEKDPRAAKKALFLLSALWRDIPDMPRPAPPQSAETLSIVKQLLQSTDIDTAELSADYVVQLVAHGAASAVTSAGITCDTPTDEGVQKRLKEVL